MQNPRPHLGSAESEPAFEQDSQVIHVHKCTANLSTDLGGLSESKGFK